MEIISGSLGPLDAGRTVQKGDLYSHIKGKTTTDRIVVGLILH